MTQKRQLLLSTGRVAELLGISIRTVQRMAKTDKIPARKLDGHHGQYVFEESDIAAYLAAQEAESE